MATPTELLADNLVQARDRHPGRTDGTRTALGQLEVCMNVRTPTSNEITTAATRITAHRSGSGSREDERDEGVDGVTLPVQGWTG
ncbi:hypothetical protein ABZS66_44520 [Dactylosporangium sp. NPDC005572]|uniref:hypothetical protein n=1 Tax=Dactylosporangium sp. NPDC005572 TaxID=3156889 RepID=UPI0033BDC802